MWSPRLVAQIFAQYSFSLWNALFAVRFNLDSCKVGGFGFAIQVQRLRLDRVPGLPEYFLSDNFGQKDEFLKSIANQCLF